MAENVFNRCQRDVCAERKKKWQKTFWVTFALPYPALKNWSLWCIFVKPVLGKGQNPFGSRLILALDRVAHVQNTFLCHSWSDGYHDLASYFLWLTQACTLCIQPHCNQHSQESLSKWKLMVYFETQSLIFLLCHHLWKSDISGKNQTV